MFVTGGDSNSSAKGDEYWKAQIESLTETHLRDTAAAREERDRKIRILTRNIEESNEDNTPGLKNRFRTQRKLLRTQQEI